MEQSNIYKLKIWTEGDDNIGEEAIFRDFYLNVNNIVGFFMPEDNTYAEGTGINIFLIGDMVTVKMEDHIVNYLNEKFVYPSVKLDKLKS